MKRMNQRLCARHHGRLRSLLPHILRSGITGVGVLFTLWVVYGMILKPDFFRLVHIKVSQTLHVRSQEIRSIFEPALGSSLLTLDLRPFLQEVSAHPWVEEVRIRKVLPHTLLVYVLEQTPAAVVKGSEGFHWVDANGVVLGPAQDQSGTFPHILGVTVEGLVRHDTDHLSRLQVGMVVIETIHGLGGNTGIEGPLVVDLGHGSRDPRLYIQGYTVRLGEGAYEEKWKSFLAIQGDIKARGLAPEEIDLRFVDQVIVKTF